jgi:hypothetical protein
MGTVHRQPAGGGAMGGLLQAVWRYKWLITAAVLVGALLGYGWAAARQPTLYEGVSRMAMDCPPNAQCVPLRSRAQLLRSPAALEYAVNLSGNKISAEALGQRLQVDVAPDADVVMIRVLDSTASGAAQLADAVMLAYDQVIARQQARMVAEQLRSMEARCPLLNNLANDVVEPGRPNDDRLGNKCDAATLAQLWEARRRLLLQLDAAAGILRERAAVPEQPIQPRPRGPIAIGMLFGLLASAALVWWLTRRHGPTSSAPEQGPELPSPA